MSGRERCLKFDVELASKLLNVLFGRDVAKLSLRDVKKLIRAYMIVTCTPIGEKLLVDERKRIELLENYNYEEM